MAVFKQKPGGGGAQGGMPAWIGSISSLSSPRFWGLAEAAWSVFLVMEDSICFVLPHITSHLPASLCLFGFFFSQ